MLRNSEMTVDCPKYFKKETLAFEYSKTMSCYACNICNDGDGDKTCMNCIIRAMDKFNRQMAEQADN